MNDARVVGVAVADALADDVHHAVDWNARVRKVCQFGRQKLARLLDAHTFLAGGVVALGDERHVEYRLLADGVRNLDSLDREDVPVAIDEDE